MIRIFLFSLLSAASSVSAGTTTPSSGPVVTLDYGSFQGNYSGKTNDFLGIPYAAPPLGSLRFASPQPPLAFSGVRQATSYAAACPQEGVALLDLGILNITYPIVPGSAGTSEDCLFLNVVAPSNISQGDLLPVLFWIPGGGFEDGDAGGNPGDTVVERSISLGEPIIYVSANYRLNAFGFLAGKEIQAEGSANAGLRDQRFALQWIQKYINLFGGDPTKVTIWGESAGAWSVGLHLVLDDGNPGGLFRAAILDSGSPLPLQSYTARQKWYDQLVEDTDCTGASDTLECIRSVSLETLQNAVNESPDVLSPESLDFVWLPCVDGEFIVRDPYESIAQGLYAKVPLLSGDVDDEGTYFALASLNYTTGAGFLDYIQTFVLPNSTSSQLQSIAEAYPDDPAQGSPFDTGDSNQLTPEFKRIAAFLGDLFFQAPRRNLLTAAAKTQDTWGFLYQRGKNTTYAGSAHSTDVPEFYGTTSPPDFIGTDVIVNFVNSLNPNIPSRTNTLIPQWPQYGSNLSAPPLLTFVDSQPAAVITTDTYRIQPIQLLNELNALYGF